MSTIIHGTFLLEGSLVGPINDYEREDMKTLPKKREPIRFILFGGFLGAGKTTALLRLAQIYTEQGLRVGIITNDQAEGLVDTLAYREAGFTTEEIPSGCFCCHFEKLIEASGRLADGLKPDIILAEPVGSCTDLVNAVITPLKSLYADQFVVAPYIALLDPIRAQEALSSTGPAGFSRKVTYIYKMQQNEADVIAINKMDSMNALELEHVETLVTQNFPKATCLSLSALTGVGFERLVALLDGPGEVGRNPAHVDYDRYTEGEIALGWLNARVAVSATRPWDGNTFLMAVAQSVREGLIGEGAQIAHFKMRLLDEQGRETALHVTSNEGMLMPAGRFETPLSTGSLIVNLRAEGPPNTLRQSVKEALASAETACHVICTTERCEAFAPNPPSPPPPERNRIRQ